MTSKQKPTDWRKLCEELVEDLQQAAYGLNNPTAQSGHRSYWANNAFQAVARARKILSQYESSSVHSSMELPTINIETIDSNQNLKEIALQMLRTIERMQLIIPEITDTIRRALEQSHPAPAPAEGDPSDPMIPSRYMSYDVNVYRDGFQEGYKHGITRATHLLEQRQSAPVPAAAGEVGVTPDPPEAPIWYGNAEAAAWQAGWANAATDLLERQVAPVPVAVSERLPQPEDCDAEGRCWWFLPSRQFKFLDQCARWSLMAHSASQDDRCRRTHWLPAHALPLPSGEVA